MYEKQILFLDPIFSDGMVMQRDTPLKIWGNSKPHESLEIRFRGVTYVTGADASGNWLLHLAPQEAGGPFELYIQVREETLVIRDILLGDVWLLGGQSNMELPIQRTLDLYEQEVKDAVNPWIRQFRVPMTFNFQGPQKNLAGGCWQAVNPQTVLEFSALGYFFAQAHYEKYGVPVGLVLTAVGGTPVEAWLEEEVIRQIGGYEEILAQCKDPHFISETTEMEMARLNRWYDVLNKDDQGLRPRQLSWSSPELDDSHWDSLNLPKSWRGTELEQIHGSVWFRKTVEITGELFEQEILLRLGAMVDADETYINGVLVGKTDYKYPPRKYKVNPGVLRSGKNTIAIRLISNRGVGGFVEGKRYALEFGSQQVDLAGEWKYKVGIKLDSLPQLTFFHYKPSGVYNGMIAPLHRYIFKGVLWYQGESNTHAPDKYGELFKALIKNWRETLGQPDLPFLYVQLPNFDSSREGAVLYNWAKLREEQLQALELPQTAMAVTIDVGEANDLHPQNKKDIALRLTRAARNLIFGETIVAQGPMYQTMQITENGLDIQFTSVDGGLISKGERLLGFELCGEDGIFYPAEALIMGSMIRVTSATVVNPKGVRYAWDDNPLTANLYNGEGLPASPFRAFL